MPFPYDSATYHEFNKQIAINHVDILHKEDRSLNEVAFGEIFISSDPFEKIDISSFMADLKSKVKFPLMLAVGTDWDARGSGSNTANVINGSFLILCKPKVSITDRDDRRRECYTTSERIAQEIIAYLIKYFEINCALGNLEGMPQGEKIGPVAPDTLYGTKVSYSYSSRYTNICFDQEQFGTLIPTADSVPDCCDEGNITVEEGDPPTFKIRFRNIIGNIISWITNANTEPRTYLFPDKDGTVAMLDDLVSVDISGKVDKVAGYGLSKNDYSDVEKSTVAASKAVTDVTSGTNTGDQDLTSYATKTYAEGLVVGLIDDRGNYNASVNTFPASGGSGTAGAILKGDLWTVSVAGTLGGHTVTAGDLVRALVDTPGQTDGNWAITENNIGYVAENASNKSSDVATDQASTVKYPTVKALYDWAAGLFATIASLAGKVPYTGATNDVDLGTHHLRTKNLLIKGTFGNYNDELNNRGANQTSDLRGYGNNYITDKTLNNVVVGSNGTASNGGFRVTTAGVFQIYLNGAWADVVTNFQMREDATFGYTMEHKPIGCTQWIEIMTGQSLNNLGMNGYPITNGYKTCRGACPSPMQIGGRTI